MLDQESRPAGEPDIFSGQELEGLPLGDTWTADGLLTAIDECLATFSRKRPDVVSEEFAREIGSIVESGFAGAAVLAASMLAAGSCSASGPVLPYGPWSSSLLLNGLLDGALLLDGCGRELGVPVAGADPTWFSQWLSTAEADVPTLLVARQPDDHLLDLLAPYLPAKCPCLQPLDDGMWWLSAAPQDGVERNDVDAPLFEIPSPGLRNAVRLIASPLWRAVVTARSAEIDLCGYATLELDAPEPSTIAGVITQWVSAGVECLGPLPRPTGPEMGMQQLLVTWIDQLGLDRSSPAALTLAIRLELIWQLASHYVGCRVAGYVGLLTVAGAHEMPVVLRAATVDGIKIVHPDVNAMQGGWHLEVCGENIVLRCPLCVVQGLDAAVLQTLDDQRAAAHFASLSDLVARVPWLPDHPALFHALVAAGACDTLAPRSRLLMHWDLVEEWLHRMKTAQLQGDVAPELPAALALAGDEQPACDDAWILAIGNGSAAPRDAAGDDLARVLANASYSYAASDHRSIAVEGYTIVLSAAVASTGALAVPLQLTVLDNDTKHGKDPEFAPDSLVPTALHGWSIGVSRKLLDVLPPYVAEVVVVLDGSREQDLARVSAVQALLDRHPGSVRARIVLMHTSFKRVIERGPSRGVSIDAAFEEDAVSLLGAGAVRVRLDSTSCPG